jgi:uncharacterized protein
MPTPISIIAGHVEVRAELNDTRTAKAIVDALPIDVNVHRWGGEIYSTIPVQMELEKGAREVVKPGELGYWPDGDAFCIFFGPTPASSGNEIRAASDVNIIGQVLGDLTQLPEVREGSRLSISLVSETGHRR